MHDLHWLGIEWPEPVLRQSKSYPSYFAAIDALSKAGLVYPCSCSRSDVEAAASAPQEGAPTHGPDGRIYPGTCRHRDIASARTGDALRLNMQKVVETFDRTILFEELGEAHKGRHTVCPHELQRDVGDVVLARRSGAPAYHVAVVVEDAMQGVTNIFRGEDLFDATPIHVLLQYLLGYPTPRYHHHRLVRDQTGKRLAKRDDARSIARYRADGLTPFDIRDLLGIAKRN